MPLVSRVQRVVSRSDSPSRCCCFCHRLEHLVSSCLAHSLSCAGPAGGAQSAGRVYEVSASLSISELGLCLSRCAAGCPFCKALRIASLTCRFAGLARCARLARVISSRLHQCSFCSDALFRFCSLDRAFAGRTTTARCSGARPCACRCAACTAPWYRF